MVSLEKGVGLLVTVVLVLLVGAALVPPAIGNINNATFQTMTDFNQTYTDPAITLEDGTSFGVTATAANDSTVEIGTGTSSVSQAIDYGNTATLTYDGKDYTVYMDRLVTSTDPSSAAGTVTYEAQNGGIAGGLWDMIPIFLVLAIALTVLYETVMKRDYV